MDDHATTLERLDAALAALKQHGIHVEENWCWCEPEVSKP
jgi:DNA-binding LacI/PurR family transcriptional regulator